MSELTADRFAEFYEAATGFPPFPWQSRVAARVCSVGGRWPRAIALPTAAGKTACIDIAVFALACQAGEAARTAPRRVFFVVDRRVVVDQAWLHARELAKVIDREDAEILRLVADRLRGLAEPCWHDLTAVQKSQVLARRRELQAEADPAKRRKLRAKLTEFERTWVDLRPLDVYALRGGMYREDTWVRSPLQPTVVTSTVDQVGSRLLFRGYGVSDSMAPVHAGLVGNDGLILLDEAHCSMPFAETAAAVERFRGWADAEAPRPPFAFVQMTATPAGVPPEEREGAADQDKNHPVLGRRIRAPKPARLVVAEKAKGKTWDKWGPPLVAELAKQAHILHEDGAVAVGVIVNRVQTARETAAALRAAEAKKPDGERARVILLTGRMRPVDRDAVLRQLEPLFSGKSGAVPPTYVVATQTLEVGADLDFHALVTECASLSALRQRFGRLNRVAARPTAPGVIVVRADQQEPAEKEADRDPVYGNSLPETWQWLKRNATDDVVDFGIAALDGLIGRTPPEDLGELNPDPDHAPVLLPAYLDCWVQTAPRPLPDPDPAIFLHGPDRPGVPDVQVVFRSDLGDDPSQWADVVALCPPSSSEALPVRIDVFKRWLARHDELPAGLADIEAGGGESEDEPAPVRDALRWVGAEDSELVRHPGDVRPNATYVVPTAAERPELLGDFPGGAPGDHAEEAFQRSRDRAVLRFPGSALDPDGDAFDEQLTAAVDALRTAEAPGWQRDAATELSDPKGRTVARYPGPLGGFVVTGRSRLRQFDPTFADDESVESPTRRQMTLAHHTRDVMAFADRFAAGCGLAALADRFALAARWHDLGKADPRFQAMLWQRSPRAAAALTPLAKSGSAPQTPREREAARAVHLYPKGGRHELLSVAFAAAQTTDDLTLHLIATHHGDGRPFAAPYSDDTADVLSGLRRPVLLFPGEAYPWPAAAGDPATANETGPDRFWRVVRRHGWWGAAYLEAVFRLADHAASKAEQHEDWSADATPVPAPPPAPPAGAAQAVREVALTGLDGSNPLAFLAAVGVLRLADQLYPGAARMRWVREGRWVPVGVSDDELVEALHTRVRGANDTIFVCGDVKTEPQKFRELLTKTAAAAEPRSREAADFLSSFADPLITTGKGETRPTALYMIAGQQKWPKLVRNIRSTLTTNHIRKALFAAWLYDDPVKELSLRWNPQDDARYATRWYNPSDDINRKRSGSVLGANALGFEALPLFPCFAVRSRLSTTGFEVVNRRTFFTWPLWQSNRSLSGVASMIALAELQAAEPERVHLRPYGVGDLFRCEKVPNSDYSNFAPSRTC